MACLLSRPLSLTPLLIPFPGLSGHRDLGFPFLLTGPEMMAFPSIQAWALLTSPPMHCGCPSSHGFSYVRGRRMSKG